VKTDITRALYRKGKERIPAGGQLLSKRPELWAPDQWPAYFRRAKGCETEDLDGNRYFDMSINAVGACLLGYGDPVVDQAVVECISQGTISSLNPPEEVALAETLCALHPWAECARFTRTGGEIATVAIRIARATTDRSAIAICGYHGWHDWYLAANLGEDDSLRGHLLPGLDPLGVPRELRNTSFTFPYNDRDAFSTIIREHGDRLAAVIMEPCRYLDPGPGFLEFVRDETHRVGALLIFDEITIGWRFQYGGAHLKFGVNPDLAIFAKALGNGYPIAAVIGTRKSMEGAHTSFISSSYWTERIGCVAALKTIERIRETQVIGHVAKIGAQIKKGWKTAGEKNGLKLKLDDGYPCMPHFGFETDKPDILKTLFTQWMLQEGFLATLSMFVTLGHTETIVSRYLEAVDRTFAKIAEAVASGTPEKALHGPVAHSGFRRLVG
jgi:glutamate-1-semialdehyde 2,1-aminomutase